MEKLFGSQFIVAAAAVLLTVGCGQAPVPVPVSNLAATAAPLLSATADSKLAESKAMEAKATDTAMKATEAKSTETAMMAAEAKLTATAMKAVEAKSTETAMMAMEAKSTETAMKAVEAKAMAARTGQFYNLDEKGAGTAVLARTESGDFSLSFKGFKVNNGPDLYVYLVVDDPVAKDGPGVIKGALSLGKLKANSGDQTYAIPTGTDISKYKSAIVWCQTYNVTFIAAALK